MRNVLFLTSRPAVSIAAFAVVLALLLMPHHADAQDNAGTKKRPNIVIFLSDDMGYSDIGCYGGEIETPNLDALAKDGLRFTQFYANNMCWPTRAALLTGIYHGRSNRDGGIAHDCVALPEALKAAGYTTWMAGKWHLARVNDKSQYPFRRGFDEHYGTILGANDFFAPQSLVRNGKNVEHEARNDPDYYYTDAISDNAAAFVHKADKDKPLFLYVAYTAAHWPLHAFEKDIKKYKGRYAMGWDQLRVQRHARMKRLGVVDPDWPLSPRHPNVPAWEAVQNKGWHERRMEVYAAQVDVMDRGIGRVIDALKETGRFENSLVCYFVDNGGCHVEYGVNRKGPYLHEKTRDGKPIRPGNVPGLMPGPEETYQSYGYGWANASNTPFRLFKQHDHEGGIRVPLIVRWPSGVKNPGSVTHAVAHVNDLMPTLLDAADTKHPGQRNGQPAVPMDGQSLVPATRGQAYQPKQYLFWKHAKGQAVREGKWKLVKLRGQPWELYDLEADGVELNDLAAKMPGRVKAMSAAWNEWQRRLSGSRSQPQSPRKTRQQ